MSRVWERVKEFLFRKKEKAPEIATPCDFVAEKEKALNSRQELLNNMHPDPGRPGAGTLGLALSGGGIRSATLALGAFQAFAKHERLLDFSYVSSVSGGGYAATFMRSLFVPEGYRGLDRKRGTPSPHDANIAAQGEIALSAFCQKANAVTHNVTLPGTGQNEVIRSPLWWLREHSRYLAPNGPTDYAMAATYMIRNWLAMLYVFLLPIAFLFIILHGLSWSGLAWASQPPIIVREVVLSPLIFLVLLFTILVLAAGIAYWLTEPLLRAGAAKSETWTEKSNEKRFRCTLFIFPVSILILGLLARLFLPDFVLNYEFFTASFSNALLAGAFMLAALAWAIGLCVYVWLRLFSRTDDFTGELRRRLTATTTRLNQWLVAALALAVVDTLALLIVTETAKFIQLGSGAAAALAAWLIAHLSQRSTNGTGLFGWMAKRLPLFAFIAGVLLFGVFAMLIDTLVLTLLFPGGVPKSGVVAGSALQNWGLWVMLLGVLTLLTGWFAGFINLSSLHNLYAARLTRAYLGASNIARLKQREAASNKPITATHACDDLDAQTYLTAKALAPLHLINVTLNETRNHDSSQLVERDRRGVPLVFGPEGIVIDGARGGVQGAAFLSWRKLHKVERLTAGQLCAISGAAASTGMAAKGSMGTALTLGFANVRLGYWWDTGDMLARKPGKFKRWTASIFGTYIYLFNELTSRYSRDYARLHLSDGGHFENSGAYELLRRRVKGIVVMDNGGDPGFQFGDMENLIRKARIDLGLSINIATRQDIKALFGRQALALFLNGTYGDWRQRAAKRVPEQSDGAFALLLNVYDNDALNGDGEPVPCMRMLWLKARLMSDLPQDIVGYGLNHPTFPQQTTADQFYNEAQWESYRGLGYCMIHALLSRTVHKADILRVFAR